MRLRINPPLPSEPVRGSRTLKVLQHFCPTKQAKNYTCGPACARAVMNFQVGSNISEAHMAYACGTTLRDGTTPEGMVRGLWFYGYPAKAVTLTRAALIARLKNGKATPILWGDWTTGGHWVVVIGVDQRKRTFLLADPMAPRGLRCHAWATLDRYWRATIKGKTYTNCGIVQCGEKYSRASKMAHNPRTRAPKGGTVGVNKEFYEGGKFLPSKADRAKQAPAHMAAGRKAEIAPRQWENRPEDWTMPLWGTFKHFIDHHHLQRTGKAVLSANETALAHYGGRERIQAAVDLFNRGVRWIYTGDHPKAGQPLE